MSWPVVAIVQARMGSTRLPGKMLELIAGQPILDWVLLRLEKAKLIDRIVLATTVDKEDDCLEKMARKRNIDVYRGDENDVLGRFVNAARAVKAASVVRVCADNPLVAPEAADLAIRAFLEKKPDYAFNHVPRMGNDYPDGLGVEVLDFQVLEQLDARFKDAAQREHVTLGIWDNVDEFDILSVECPEDWRAKGENIRLDVDTLEDLEMLRTLCRELSPNSTIAEILDRWRNTVGNLNS